MTHYQAYLCDNCSWSSKKENCVKCDKWIGSSGVLARLCDDFGWSSKKEYCVKCGKWAP